MTPSTTRPPQKRALRASVAGLVLLGLSQVGATDAAFRSVTINTSTVTAHPDWRPPTVLRAVTVRDGGSAPGYISPSAQYRVYAAVEDDQSSNPPAGFGPGLGSVKANVSAWTATAGNTEVDMAFGNDTVRVPAAANAPGGTATDVTYTHRSEPLTARTTLTLGAGYNIILTARDGATPANTSANYTFQSLYDNTPPAPTMLAINNGGTAGRPDLNDTLVFTWDFAIDPASLGGGWTGTPATANVTVRIVDELVGGTRRERLSIWNDNDTVQLNFGTIDLGAANYVNDNTTTRFGATNAAVRSTLVWSNLGTSFTLRLGAVSNAANLTNATTAGSHVWTASNLATDRAGNRSTQPVLTEAAGDRDF